MRKIVLIIVLCFSLLAVSCQSLSEPSDPITDEKSEEVTVEEDKKPNNIVELSERVKLLKKDYVLENNNSDKRFWIPQIQGIASPAGKKSINDQIKRELTERIDYYFRTLNTQKIDYTAEVLNFEYYIEKDLLSFKYQISVDSTEDTIISFAYNIDLETGKKLSLYRLFGSEMEAKRLIESLVLDDINADKDTFYQLHEYLGDFFVNENCVEFVRTDHIYYHNSEDSFIYQKDTLNYDIATEFPLEAVDVIVYEKNEIVKDESFEGRLQYLVFESDEMSTLEDINWKHYSEGNDFIQSIKQASIESIEESKELEIEPSDFYASILTDVQRNSNNILSFTTDYYMYTGGAHGSSVIEGSTYHLETGKRYTLGDLFKRDADYIKEINSYLEPIIKKNKYIDEDAFKGVDPDQPYVLTEDGVKVIFQTYELGPYSLGPVLIEIPYDKLSLKEEIIL